MKLKKKIIISFISITILIFIFFIPEIFIAYTIDKKIIKQEIKNFLSKSSLAISYDGLSVSAYQGIALYQVRISAEKDFSRGRTFLYVPELIIPVSFSDLYNKKLKYFNIEIINSVIELWIEKKVVVKDLSMQIQQWIKNFENIRINIKNSKLQLNLRKSSYEKEKWTFNNFSAKIYRKENNFRFSANIDDEKWGNLNLHFKPLKCFIQKISNLPSDLKIINTSINKEKNSTCKWWMGSYKIKTMHFPMSKVSWWLDNWKLKKGRLDSHFNILFRNKSKYKNKFNLEVQSKGNLLFNNLYINRKLNKKKESIFLSDFTCSVNINYHSFNSISSLDLEGKINDHIFNYHHKKNEFKLWADEIKLNVSNPKKIDTPLQLPYNIKLTGLKTFSFHLENSKQIVPYRHLNAKLIINEGRINFLKYKVDIPHLSFNIDKDKYNLIAKTLYKKSDLNFDLKGYLRTIQYEFVKSLFFSYTSSTRVQRTQSVFFFSNHTGSIHSNTIYGTDFQEIYNNAYDSWHNLSLQGNNAPHRSNNIHQVKIFQDFFAQAAANIQVKINNWVWNNKEKYSAQGNLFYKNKIFSFKIKDETENHLKIDCNFVGNYPAYQFNTKIKLNDGYAYFRLFYPTKIIKDFDGIDIEYKFHSSGVWAYTIYHALKSEGFVKLSNVKLGSYFTGDRLPEKWNELSFRVKRYGIQGYLYDISAENNTSELRGQGRWKSQYLVPKWQFTYKMKLKE